LLFDGFTSDVQCLAIRKKKQEVPNSKFKSKNSVTSPGGGLNTKAGGEDSENVVFALFTNNKIIEIVKNSHLYCPSVFFPGA
jgi:hypothetical protein